MLCWIHTPAIYFSSQDLDLSFYSLPEVPSNCDSISPLVGPEPPHPYPTIPGALSDGFHVTRFWNTVAPLLFPPASRDLGPYFVLEPTSLCQRSTVWRNDASSHVGEKSWQQLRETPEQFSLRCILIAKELSEWEIAEMPLAGGGQKSLQEPRS